VLFAHDNIGMLVTCYLNYLCYGSCLVQLYNAVLLHDALPATDSCTDWWSVPNCVLS